MQELHQHAQQTKRSQKTRIFFAIKLTISLGLMLYLIALVDWIRVHAILKGMNAPFLFGVLLVAFFRLIFAAFRWQRILRDNQVALPFGFAYASYLIGAFYNIFLPGVTGGDVIRAGRCIQRTRCSWGTAAATVILERMSGMLATLLMAFVTYLCFPRLLASLIVLETGSFVTFLSALGIFGMCALIVGRRKWLQWLPSQESKGIWGFVVSGMRTLGVLQGYTFALILLSSVLFQGFEIIMTFLLSEAMGLQVPLPIFFAIIPLVYLAVMLPISLGGLGVREGMFAFLLSQFGVTTSDAITLSFLVYCMHVITAGIGGLVQFAETLTNQHIE